jgi:NADPH:quinone reductase
MRAVAVDSFGAAPRLMDLPRPSPGPGELLVRLSAAGLNPFDAKIARGILKGRPHRFPLVLGVDGAGWVEAVGSGVQRFEPGVRLFGSFLHDPVGTGTYAEYTTVPEGNAIVPTPSELSDVEAAALPTAGMAALDSLDRLEVGSGSTLLVVGASGGIGSVALPLARGRGARVLAVARGSSEARLRALGAEIVLDPNGPEWAERVRSVAPRGVDALLDLMSDGDAFARAAHLVRPGGRAATTVYAMKSTTKLPEGVDGFNIDLQPSSRLLLHLVEELRSRGIRLPPGRTIPLPDSPSILSEITAGRAVGKTVIVIGGPGP